MIRLERGVVYHVRDLSINLQVCLFDLVLYPRYRIWGGSLSRVLCPKSKDADRFIPDLHDSILDEQCDPHDFLDSPIGEERDRQHRPNEYRDHRPTDRVASLLRIFGDIGLCASLYLVYGGPDF